MERLQSNSTDSFFSDKYQQLLPYYNAFNEAYDSKFGNQAQHKGNTKLLSQQLKSLTSNKIHAWDIKIQNVYLKTTPEYTIIFPQGLTPFSSLPIDRRIKYLGNAVAMMGNYSSLSVVCDEMNQFYLDLVKARNNQEQKDGNVNDSRGDVMQKAYDLADEIYALLGEFMAKYKKNPLLIDAYFPVFLLRKKRKSTNDTNDFYDILIPKADKKEGGFNFKNTEKINFYITGNTSLEIYFVADKNAPKPGNTIILAPQDIKTILISDYASLDDRFLIIENLSATEDGEIEITMV
jgi:hypothetical protein